MSPVAADLVINGVFVFYRVGGRLLRNGLMERRVKNENLRDLRHDGSASLDTHEVRRRMERSKIVAQTEFFDHLGGHAA